MITYTLFLSTELKSERFIATIITTTMNQRKMIEKRPEIAENQQKLYMKLRISYDKKQTTSPDAILWETRQVQT